MFSKTVEAMHVDLRQRNADDEIHQEGGEEEEAEEEEAAR
jgi:hypothetical protein